MRESHHPDGSCPDDGYPNPFLVFTYKQLQTEHPELYGVKAATFVANQAKDVHPIVVKGLVCTEIIARILGLSDLITNPHNICFVCDREGKLAKFQIVDFALKEQYFETYHNPKRLYLSFAAGNGYYRYVQSKDKVVYYFLSSRERKERIAYARELFTIAEFIGWIDAAEEKVTPTLEELNQAEQEKGEEGKPVDLERFHELVRNARRNAEVFLRALGAPEE